MAPLDTLDVGAEDELLRDTDEELYPVERSRLQVLRATVGVTFAGCLCLIVTLLSGHAQALSFSRVLQKLSLAQLVIVHRDGFKKTNETQPRPPWSSFWPQAESRESLGSGDPIHARGLIQLRGLGVQGLACLHAEKGYGAGIFMGQCEESTATQQWQYDARTSQMVHEFAGCLDAGGETLHMWSCDMDNPSQKWEHDLATGSLKNSETGTCIDSTMLGAQGEPGFTGVCSEGVISQQWSVGVRLGHVQLWTSSCMWAESEGDLLTRRNCGMTEGKRWQFSPSTGQLNLRQTTLCATAEADDFIRLRQCDPGGNLATQHWLYNVRTGMFKSQMGSCLDGSGEALLMQDCVQDDLDQRWSPGVTTGQLQHAHGLCIHAHGDAVHPLSVSLRSCEGEPHQQWSYDDRSGKIQHLNGFCLEMSAEGVSVSTCRLDLWGQQWVYDKYTRRIKHGNQCLEASEPNKRGVKVALSPCVMGRWQQEWDISWRRSVTALFTVETRNKHHFINMHGVPGRMLQNVGFDAKWHGFKTKVDCYQEAMIKWSKHDPEDIVILTDTDVAYGGCGEEELLRRYRTVVRASGGATVMTSADANQYPPIEGGMKQFQRLRQEREPVLTAFGLTPDSLDEYCARDWNGTVPIAIEYGFVNSGFIMGPAGDLKKILACMQIEGWDQECVKKPWCKKKGEGMVQRKVAGYGIDCCFDDQRALSRCALKHPDKITIDYTGTIMMTTYGMHNMFEVRPDTIYNTISNTTQCFVHANCYDWSQPMKWDAWLGKLKKVFKGAV